MLPLFFFKVSPRVHLKYFFLIPFLLHSFSLIAIALEVPEEEQRTIKKCEQKLCSTILGKKNDGEDLHCILSKTWDRDTIKKGGTNSLQWGFGDARCSVNLNIKRREILSALVAKQHTTEIPPHHVQCIVELNGKERNMSAKVAPKLVFKDGRVEKIWINLSNLDGPTTITSFVWMVTQLEDKMGIFHKSMVKSVNKFIYQKCSQNYFADGTPKSPNNKKP